MFTKHFITRAVPLVLFLVLAVSSSDADSYDQYFHQRQVITQYYLAGWNWWQYYPVDHVWVGKQDDANPSYEMESFRAKYRWDISSIPDNATINSATLRITSIATSNKPNTNFLRFFVRSSSSSDWNRFDRTAWQSIAGGTQYDQVDQITGGYFTTQFNYSIGSNFCNDIQGSLASNVFIIGLRTDEDETWGTGMGTVHSIDVRTSGGDLSTAVTNPDEVGVTGTASRSGS